MGRAGPEGTRDGFAEGLRAARLRVTAPRLGVMLALAGQPHSDTDTVIRAVRRDLGSVSAQAVYNVLAAVEVGLVRRIEPAGSPALYEIRVGDNHHHIVCRTCGATSDVDCAVGRRPCLTPAETRGYVLDEAEVTFWGLCPDCQSPTRGSATNGSRPPHREQAAARPEKKKEGRS